MASNPVPIPCPVDTWVLVASSVQGGTIHRTSSIPEAYIQTIRVAADPAPTDDTDAALIFVTRVQASISSDAPIDVYIKAKGAAGEVRVDL